MGCEGEKSSLFHFLPAGIFSYSSVSVAVLPESDVQKASQIPNLVKKKQQKLPHLTKISCIYEQLMMMMMQLTMS